ncbi:MAG: 5'/3'-nucleotidase SurE [Legionellales bacterium]|jgi:5'-nucleotidase|nr:5'/3'-nucleotidase SurE [Legionellales bacterium]
MKKKPVILISNDDGIYSEALDLMERVLSDFATVYVVVPDRDKSGTSQCLTLMDPVHLNWVSENKVSVQGTPADCVHLAITGLLPVVPDLVVSGINLGANLGDDVLYSGTLAAAFEASTCGIPALAFSLDSHKPNSYDIALEHMKRIVIKHLEQPLKTDTVLNINIPYTENTDVQGIKVTRLGRRDPSLPMIKYKSPRGRDCYWIGRPGAVRSYDKDTDFTAVRDGYISVTPLHIDMTEHSAIKDIEGWL